MISLLKQNIAKHISLSENETEEFCNLFQPKSIKKKGFLLRAGEVCRFEGFVTRGLFRVYHIDQNGFDQILYFAVENWWITDIDSFTNESPRNFLLKHLKTARCF
jgi:CRP-like cAMP-binding protein